MIREFTKKERHFLYKRSLNLLNRNPFYCLCGCLHISNDRFKRHNIHKHFPEFDNFRPTERFNYGDKFFFEDCEKMDIRIKTRKIILQFCIEMTR